MKEKKAMEKVIFDVSSLVHTRRGKHRGSTPKELCVNEWQVGMKKKKNVAKTKKKKKIPDALHTRGHLLDGVMRQRLAWFLTTRSEMGLKDEV